MQSLKDNGFQESHGKIPTIKGLAINGAHRIASCIALGKNVLSEESDISKGQIDCTSNYFLNKKILSSKVLEEIMLMKWH